MLDQVDPEGEGIEANSKGTMEGVVHLKRCQYDSEPLTTKDTERKREG